MQHTARDRLLAAARRVLGIRGYDAATVREIAAEAGVPFGLVHYHFGGKEGLLAALLVDEARAYRAEQEALGAAAVDGPAAIAAALDRRRRRVARDPAWHRLRYELFAMGLRNPALAGPLRDLLEIGRDGVRQVMRRGWGEAADPALAGVILACLDGLALQSLADPAFDLDAAYDALSRLLPGGDA